MMQSGSPRRSRRLAAHRQQATPRLQSQSQSQPRPPSRPGTRARPRPRKQKKRETTTTSPRLRKTGIQDLPPELREMIVLNLIHAVRGPEVYVGKGSRAPVLMEPVFHSWRVHHFHSSITDTIEMCVAILESVVPRDTPSQTSRKATDCKLIEHSGSSRDYSRWPDHHEQSWGPAYHKLRPLMACKNLYYEATAIFFREKHFVLGSSTYAHAWLRRIGQRNQVNLRNIRLKIHKEFTAVGDLNTSGSLWIEVLKKLGRSAHQLKVLGFQFDDDADIWRSTLLRSFLRMKSFQNLKQIDFFHCFLPLRANSEEFLSMMAASTGCASVRCLELSNMDERGYRLIRQAFHEDNGQVHLSEEI